MRTTVTIDDSLYRRVKARAASSGRSVSSFIEDALRVAVLTKSTGEAGKIEPLPVFGGSGVLPGVDLGDSAALRDLMDEGKSVDALR